MAVLTLYHLQSEPWRIGMNETVYGKHSKLSGFIPHKKFISPQEKIKTFQETVSFHLASNHSNYLNQMYFHIFYISALPAGY